MKRLIGYAFLALWVALAAVLQLLFLGWTPAPDLAVPGAVLARALTPDLATIVLVASVGRLARRDVLTLALAAAVGRATFSASPPLAVLTGCFLVALVADGVRGMAELDRPALRIVAAGLGALLFTLWLGFVDFVRFEDAGARGGTRYGAVDPAAIVGAALTTAVTTATIAFAFWPLFARLPGLSRLERRAF